MSSILAKNHFAVEGSGIGMKGSSLGVLSLMRIPDCLNCRLSMSEKCSCHSSVDLRVLITMIRVLVSIAAISFVVSRQ